jgi:hypothetical protein
LRDLSTGINHVPVHPRQQVGPSVRWLALDGRSAASCYAISTNCLYSFSQVRSSLITCRTRKLSIGLLSVSYRAARSSVVPDLKDVAGWHRAPNPLSLLQKDDVKCPTGLSIHKYIKSFREGSPSYLLDRNPQPQTNSNLRP